MIKFINKTTFQEFINDEMPLKYELQEALIEADFGVDEVEMRFLDSRVMSIAIRIFNEIALKWDYKVKILRETEIFVYGLDGNEARYIFMNSIPSDK